MPALMDDHFDAYYDEYHDALEPDEPERPRDRRIDEAKDVLLEGLFAPSPSGSSTSGRSRCSLSDVSSTGSLGGHWASLPLKAGSARHSLP